MNIFALAGDIEFGIIDWRASALLHDNSRVHKMIVESAQMLSTTFIHFGLQAPYKSTHINHPCNKWLRESYANCANLYKLFVSLSQEYNCRFDKVHKSFLVCNSCFRAAFDKPNTWHTGVNLGETNLPLCMPAEYIIDNNPILSYRNYFANKPLLRYFDEGEIPEWVWDYRKISVPIQIVDNRKKGKK
jgi:hypothetical protein